MATRDFYRTTRLTILAWSTGSNLVDRRLGSCRYLLIDIHDRCARVRYVYTEISDTRRGAYRSLVYTPLYFTCIAINSSFVLSSLQSVHGVHPSTFLREIRRLFHRPRSRYARATTKRRRRRVSKCGKSGYARKKTRAGSR